ncbi:hypothetical protein [Adlercreutzia mucosicola]|uniref:hypothetical protein n=1 Tax=Adlercreutzia mucosicola TaxID=580026 RepID=UPI00048875AA|nr:hypothetical protein [Adlercreutzia mucosicola]MCR2035032.1 hypothetical protein [Adlercreutzia mucosicola]
MLEEAAVHTADGLAAEPMLLAVVVIAVALIVAAVLVSREIRAAKDKQLEVESNNNREKLKLQREVEMQRLEIDRDREQHKIEDRQQRAKTDAEMMALQRQTIEASNRSTAAIEAMSRLMDTHNTRLEVSQDRSRAMGEQIQDVHATVHAIDNNVQDLADALLK